MKSVLGKQRNNKSFWVKAVILFLSFLFVASTLGVSLSLFRDNTSDEQNNDFAPIVLSDNSFNTLKSQISFDMMGKSVLVQPVSFVISKDTSSSVYVRAYVNLESAANDARQKLAYESLTAATPIAGKNYKWTRFGQYYYLCDSSNQLASLSSANAGEVFNLLEKETNLVPEDIIDDKFASGEKVSLGVTLQSVQTSKVSSKNVEQAHSAFNAVEPTLANTKTQCSIYFYDANGLSLGNQTVAYGKGVNIPTPASQSGKQQIGWNTKSDYTGATLDEEDLSSVYEDLVLYAEFDALTYNVTVIQPTDEAGNQIGTITPGSTTMRYGQSLTFRVVPATNYYIYGVYIENEETHQKKNIGSVNEFVVSGYASDIKIWADISQEIIFLDINGGTGTQPKITFNEEKTKFVLSETEPVGPGGKEFYYYSTNPLDNEEGQNGIRIDLGVEYPLSYLEDNKVLYAIYLTPTENYQTATNYIVVPKNVTSIEGVGEKNMFGVDTPDVKFVTLPRSVKKIGNGAFRNLDGLTGLSMSTVVDSIGNGAFENCVSLRQFVFGPFVNKIGEGAFKNCVSLSILKNFETIPTTEFVDTFEGCSMLISVTMPSVATKIERTFKNCSNLLEVILPDGLRNIGESTFENCTALSTIEIPSTTSFLGAKAFRNCVALNKIVGLEDVVAVEIPDFMFENCVSLTQLSIPSNTALIGAKAFASCSSLEKITNLSVVKVGEVCDEAFVDCTNLKELIFNGSLKIVGARAFSRSGITKSSLSQRLADLGESAFEDCVNLSTIQNLGVITKIAQKTFKNCSNLFSITIPSTVTTIETLAFENCSMLTSLNIPVAVQTIGVDALKNATGLKSITLQGDLSTIYDLASTKQNWYYNTNPTDSLDKKGYYTTFVSDWIITNINGNNYITGYRGEDVNVTIPYIITDERGEQTYIYGVALNTYEKISGFENVVIDEGIQSILILEGINADDKNAISYPCFKDCKTLKSITLPSTLSLLSDGAFAGCTNLTEIIGLENTKVTKLGELFSIPTTNIWGYDEVIRINGEDVKIKYNNSNFFEGSNRYRGMFEETSLKEVNLPSNLQIIGPLCFSSMQLLRTIHVPASVRAIGAGAFGALPMLESITGLENCVLDYKTTVNGMVIECGFAAAIYQIGDGAYFQNIPVFMELLSLKTLTLPAYATIFTSDFSLGQVGSLIAYCPALETIILPGDLSQEFSLASTNDSEFGINSYSWYLRSSQVTTAREAGTYTIFPGDDDSDWVADENGMIIAYKGINSVVTVPSSIIQNGKTIQIKGIKTFRNKILTDVTISEGLSIIDANAFADMTRLKKVKLASSITTIGDAAFENCTNLTSIVLPEKATNVGSDIFKNCSSIKIIVLNNNISTEQNLANVSDGEWFYQNGSSSISASQMKSKGVYSKYSSLATTDDWEVKTYENKNYITAYLGTSREITVPAVVVESDYSNIYEIYGLAALKKFSFTSIIVSEGIETIGLDIVLESEADYAVFTSLGLGDPTDLENGIYLPFMRYSEESKYIENLSTLILPDSLKIVGLFGLGGVRLNGTNTLIEIKNISTMLMNAFAETKVDEIRINLNATKTLSKISEYAFSNSTAQSISIGYGPTLIEASAFSGCTNLTELNIPLSVVTIENGAFDDCESLRVLNLGNARQIGRISNCSNLEKIVLGASLYNPYSVSNIYGKNGSTWFYEGGSDTAVSYFDLAGTYLAEKPDLSTLWTYTEINGKWYITGYTGDSTNLTVPSSLVINGTETQIDGIKSINTKEGVDIESVIVSEGIAEILDEAFVGKTKLSKITLPSTLTSIGKNAFSGTIISLLALSSENLTLNAGALDGMSELNIINVQTAIKSQYTLPTQASWTYISYSDDQSSSSSTTTLWEQGIYTTLANVATTIEWIVGSENDSYYIAGYKLECTGTSFVLEVPRLVINHKTFEVYEISSIKSLYLSKLSNSSIEITLKISEGITKLDVDYYTNSYSMTDVLGENYYNIYRSLRGAGYSQSNINNIVSIEFPSTLIDIGTHTFNHLTGLRELKNFENTRITSVGQQVFESNNNLTQLEFPATLKSFSSSNFSSCSALKKIVLNSTLESSFDLSDVGNGIWYFNSETIRTISMRKAGIYSSSPIQNIGLWVVELIKGKNYITAYLGGATELVVPHEIYDKDTGKIVQIYGVRGVGKTDLETITFEEGIEEIGQDGATINIFGGNCPNLKKISMSSTLTTIYDKALDNISADNIVITIYGTQKIPYTLSGIKNTKWFYGGNEVSNMQEIGSYTTFQVLAYMPDEETITKILSATTAEERNNAAQSAGYASVDNAWFLGGEDDIWFSYGYLGTQSEIVVPRYVMDYTNKNNPILRELDTFYTIVKDGLYQDITKITLEEGYVQFGIGDEELTPAVSGGGMNFVKEIVLPSTLTKLGSGAFAGLVSLEKINLEDTKLTTIAPYAFVDAINLKKIKLPETVKKIDAFAFYGAGLVELELNEGLISIAELALAGLSDLKVLTIPSTISSIPKNSMYYDFSGGSETIPTLSSLEKIIIKKDLSAPLSVNEVTNNVYYKNGSQIALSNISEAGTYLSYICGTSDDWKYETIDGKNYITEYCGKKVVVDVPTYIWDRATGGTIEIYGVKSLNNSKIRKLTVREGIKSVGNGATNIISGTFNNSLTYVSLPFSLIENDSHILDGCNALESINIFGDLQNALETSDIKQATWHSHTLWLKNYYWKEKVENYDDVATQIAISGGYSTYTLGNNIVQAKTAQGGYCADLWAGDNGESVDAFIPAFGIYEPERIAKDLIGSENAYLFIKVVPMESVITLRGYAGTASQDGFTGKAYSKDIVFNSMTFAEGFTRIGDVGNKNNGFGSQAGLIAIGSIVNRVNKVGSEDKINLLSFDGSFENSVPSDMAKNGLSILNGNAYSGSKSLSYSKSGASKATVMSIQLEKGIYVFEAMVKSSVAGSPLQVQLSSDETNYSMFYSEPHVGDENYQYIFVKFEVQSQVTAQLNLIQSAIYDCMNLYRVDRGLPTTLTILGANAFLANNYLSSINLSQTAIEEIEMFALACTFANFGAIDHDVVEGKYVVKNYRIIYTYDSNWFMCNINNKLIKFPYSDGIMTAEGYTIDFDNMTFSTPDGHSYEITKKEEMSFYISGMEVDVDWSFDPWTNTLTYVDQNISMVESSEEMFWGDGFAFNARTNRLTTPDGKTYTQRFFVQNGKLLKDVLVAVPRTLTTLGHMSLNTGATRYIGLEKSSLKSLEVVAFGGDIYAYFDNSKSVDASMFGENLVELNLPATFEEITKGSSSDIAIGPLVLFGVGGISGLSLTYPSDFEGYAFTMNYGLQNINVAQDNPVFSSKDGVLFNVNQSKLIAFPNGRTGTYSIPETVRVVGQASFMSSALSYISIPSNLVTIEDYAFCGTIFPTLVVMGSEGIDEYIRPSQLKGFIGLENSSVETIGRGALAILANVKSLDLPSSLKTIGGNGDVAISPIAYSGFNYIKLNSQLTMPVTLQLNITDDDDVWLYNLSSPVAEMQPAGIYSKGTFENVWKVEEIDGNWWIVAYLGSSTSLTVPNVVLNDAGEIVKVYGLKSINYQNATQLTISGGIKEIGYPTDTTNILGSTSNSKLSSITLMGIVENMTENSLLGMNGLTCLTLDDDLNSANSFAPTGRPTWYYYSNGTSGTVSAYEKAGIYTLSELQREKEEWVVDSDGYIIAYNGTKTELVVPSHLLKQYSDEVIIVKGIKSFSNIRENDYFWDSNNKRFNYSDTLCNVTSVTVSEGIKTIENQSFSVFRYLSNVVEINLSSTTTYIGENAFMVCEKLEQIRIPSSVNTIEVSALPMDKNLATVILDGTLKTAFEIPENYGTWFYNSDQTPVDEMFVSGTYKKATYNIRYVGNGGTLSNGESSYEKSNIGQGKTITLDQNQFSSSANAQFLGWTTDPKGMYVEYQEGDSFVLENSTRVPNANYTINFYAVWKRDINVLTLDPNFENSTDPEKGFVSTKFGNSSKISSEVAIDLSKEVILTGSFSLSTLGKNTRLISIMSGSNGIELYSNASNQLVLWQNGNAVLTSTNTVLSNVGYSYFIYKTYGSIKFKVLKNDGTVFFEQTAASATMTGIAANYVLGYEGNSVSVIYGTVMLFESSVLKLAYLPNEANPNHMIKIKEDGSQSLAAINAADSVKSTNLVVWKMIPTSLGSTLPTEVLPSKFGHEFGGFYYTRGQNSSLFYDSIGSSSLLEGADNYTIDADVTAEAYWIAKDVEITYNANGGNGEDVKQTIKFDAKFKNYDYNNKFSRQGYTLTGWIVDGWAESPLGLDTEYTFNYIKSDWNRSDPSYEITFKAQWTPNTYHVTYHPNGGSGTSYTVDIVYDTEFVLLDITDSHINFTMKGHSFDRWRGSNGSEWKGWVGKPWIWTYAQDVTLYAQWTANTYHATYTPNGGVGNDYKVDIVYGQNFVLLDNTDSHLGYTRDGYKFYYWNEAANGSGSSWKDYVGKEWKWTYDYDITLYAQWNKIYDVVYTANGGTGADYTTKIVKTEQFVLLDNTDSHLGFTRTGYTFSYWSTKPDGSDTSWKSYINKPWTWSYDYGLTFYAIWTPNTYTVTANANGGTIPTTSGWTVASGSKTATKTVTFDSTYGTLPTPTKTGFAFGGWAGKNLFNKSATAFSTGHYISGNGSTTSYAAYNIYQISVPAGATITIKNSGASSAPGYAFYTTYGVYVSGANFGGKATVTTTVPSNATYIRVSVNMGGESGNDPNYRKDIDYFQIEIGSSATSYESYKTITSSTQMTTQHNHTVTAMWTPNTYKVTLDNQSATTAGTTAYWYKYKTYVNGKYYYSDEACTTGIGGTNGNAITKPTRKGYTFGGYFTGKNGTGTQYVDANGYCVNSIYSNVAGNTTLYAKWTEHVLTIRYHLNGGTPVSGNAYFTNADPCKTEKWSYSSSSQYGLTNCDDTARVTKTGYAAQGYYNTKADGSGANLDDDTLTTTIAIAQAAGVLSALEAGNTTLNIYMQWKPKTYTVTYEYKLTDKGWMYSNITHQTRFKSWNASGETLNIKTHGGSGWEVRYIGFPVEKGRTYTWSFDYTMPTLTANFGGIGAGKMRAQVLTSTPSNDNCISKQINTTAGSGYYEMTSASSGTAKLTFTATANAEYLLVLNFGYCDDGKDLDFIFKNIKLTTTKTVTYDSTYGAMPSSWYYGYRLSKWTNSSGTTITTSTKVTTASNHTLYANMTANTYNLTFDVQTISPNSRTVNGVTITKNSDGSLTFNGTLSASTGALVYLPIQFKVGQKFQIYSTYISGNYSRAESGNSFVFELYKTNSGGQPSTRCNSDVRTPSQSNANTRIAHGAKEVTTDEQAACRYIGFWIWANSSSTTYTFNNYRVKLEFGTFQQQSITFNSTYGDLPTPVKTGYTFAGWFTSASGGTEMTTTSRVLLGNQTLYAHWTGNKYTVKFNANGGSGTMADQKFTYGTAQNLTANAFTRTGYKFAGWATSATGSKIYNDKESVTNLAHTQGATVTLYAKWTINSYALSIDPNGGYRVSDNSTAVITVTKNYQASENISERRKTGYTLTGYTLKNTASGSTTDIGGATFTFNNSTKIGVFTQGTVACTLVAQWTSSVTITIVTSLHYSDFTYTTSNGKSGSLTEGGSTTIVGIPIGTRITISATVVGCWIRTSGGYEHTTYYGFKLSNGTSVLNYSASTTTKGLSITTSDGLNGAISIDETSYTEKVESLCCVDGESEIAMADGTTKTIKNIKAGDKVLSYNIDKKALETASVEVISVVQRSEIVHITFGDGTMLKITSDHPMFSSRGWIVKDYESGCLSYPNVDIQKEPIDVGDMLLSLSLMFDKEVVDIKLVEGSITCYTLKVSQNSNYFAQNVLVHNGKECLKPCAFGVCCVDGETDITMADGTTKKAKDISFGDKVLSFNKDTNSYEITTIEFVSTPIRYEILEITFDDGSTLKITNDHPMLTKRGWTAYNLEQAQKMYASLNLSNEALHEGDEIVSLNGTKTITSIKLIEFDDAEIVYTFGLANNQAFIANGKIVASVPKND